MNLLSAHTKDREAESREASIITLKPFKSIHLVDGDLLIDEDSLRLKTMPAQSRQIQFLLGKSSAGGVRTHCAH